MAIFRTTYRLSILSMALLSAACRSPLRLLVGRAIPGAGAARHCDRVGNRRRLVFAQYR